MDSIYGVMDADTAALILRLQREDIEALISRSKGKQREGEPCDADTALQLQLQELNLIETFRDDRRMARSHALAVIADREILSEEIKAEDQACHDHALAARLEVEPNANLPAIPKDPQPECENEVMIRQEARMRATITIDNVDGLACDACCDDSECIDKTILCVACNEENPWYDVIKAPCNHDYCSECLTTLFDSAMTDETLYPPRCCRQPISISVARTILNPKLVEAFKEKSIELDTKDRTYCFDPVCSRFISGEYIEEDIATCAGCGKRTCAICKGAAHIGDCPRNETLQQLLEVADNQGWQRCYVCRRVVDLKSGCNHITCHCGAEFCYVCGAPWKPRSCSCPQWDEGRLEERAAQIVARNPRHRLYQPPQGTLDRAAKAGPATARTVSGGSVLTNHASISQLAVPDPQHLLRVREIMRDLEENHECDHDSWKYIAGSHRCEECHFQLPQYIFECRQCHLRACFRCRRNRL